LRIWHKSRDYHSKSINPKYLRTKF
jgi:hypothetical protein